MKYNAAIFDMDGLLLDSERICMECFLEVCQSLGHTADPAIYMKCIGSNRKRALQILRDGYGDSFPLDEVDRLWEEAYHREIHTKPIPLKPGVKELLEALSKLNIPIGVATSTAYDLACIKLKNAGLYKYLQFVVAGDQVSNGKPDPEIYLMAALKHHIPVEQCIAFEDSQYGVQSAYAAGITVIQVPDLIMPTDKLKGLGHQIVDSLFDIDIEELF